MNTEPAQASPGPETGASATLPPSIPLQMSRALAGRPPWLLLVALTIAAYSSWWSAGRYWLYVDYRFEHAAAMVTPLLPLFAAAWVWWRIRALRRGEALQSVILTTVSRGNIVDAALRWRRLFHVLIALLMPLVLLLGPQHFLGPLAPLIFMGGWHPGLIVDGYLRSAWWHEPDGRLLVAAVTLLWLYASMTFAIAAATRCSIGGRGSARSLAWSLALAAMPLVLGLALFLGFFNAVLYFHDVETLGMHACDPYFWWDKLLPGYTQPAGHYLIAWMSCIAALPALVAALFAQPLMRSAARRLDGLVTD